MILGVCRPLSLTTYKGDIITNIYVIDSVEYLHKELTLAQKECIKPFIGRTIYDKFRNMNTIQ